MDSVTRQPVGPDFYDPDVKTFEQSRDLLSVGAYVPGGDPETDLAIARQPAMASYLRQGLNDNDSLAPSSAQLAALFSSPGTPVTRAPG